MAVRVVDDRSSLKALSALRAARAPDDRSAQGRPAFEALSIGPRRPRPTSRVVPLTHPRVVGYDARMMLRTVGLPLLVCLPLAACGDDQSGPSDDTGGQTSGDTGEQATTGQSDATGPVDPTEGGSVDDTTGGDASGDSGEASDTAPPTTGTSGGDSDSDTDTGEPSPWDGEPLPPADDGEWNWVDFPDAKCRDGSPTGIGVRYGSGDGLVIYFQGGGACFNGITCGTNPASFNAGNFAGFSGGAGAQNFFSTDGQNPVGDWSFIYVPYCTGDVHAGARPDATVDGVIGQQQFVGYTNVGYYLDRVVPTFIDGTTRVLVAGESAGGFGAAFNYDRIAEAFPGAAVSLLDDSGPPLDDDVMAPCLQKQWREAWNLDLTMPADCDACFPPDGGGIINLAAYLGEKWSDQRLVLISSLHDTVIRFFFGFGGDECNALLPNTPAGAFEAGLYDLRDNFLQTPAGVWGTYYIDSDTHTWIGGGGYFSQEVDGVKIVDFVRALTEGQVSHVAP